MIVQKVAEDKLSQPSPKGRLPPALPSLSSVFGNFVKALAAKGEQTTGCSDAPPAQVLPKGQGWPGAERVDVIFPDELIAMLVVAPSLLLEPAGQKKPGEALQMLVKV